MLAALTLMAGLAAPAPATPRGSPVQHQIVSFNAFGAAAPDDAPYASNLLALGYEVSATPRASWSIDLRMDWLTGDLDQSNPDRITFLGAAFNWRYFPAGTGPRGFSLGPFLGLGFGSFISNQTVDGIPVRVLVDAGAMEAGFLASWAWILADHVYLRAGLGLDTIYVPDLQEFVLAAGLTGELTAGFLF